MARIDDEVGQGRDRQDASEELASFAARPHDYVFDPKKTAVLCIDMQRDFLEHGGFGWAQGGDDGIKRLQAIYSQTERLYDLSRRAGLTLIHTRALLLPERAEVLRSRCTSRRRSDLSDCPTPKLGRRKPTATGQDSTPYKTIGDPGATGSRMLIRGEPMHDFVDRFAPLPGEIVLDKPGKGAFYGTDLHLILSTRSISHLIVCGVTAECCVSATVREANDRGFEVCVVADCTAGYGEDFAKSSIELVCFADGLFGYVATLSSVARSLQQVAARLPEPKQWGGSLDLDSLRLAYARRLTSPDAVVAEVYRRIGLSEADPGVWLHLVEEAVARQAAVDLLAKYPDPASRPPLFGVPFSVKDSLDYAGVPTTGACPAYSFVPSRHARSVELLIEAGAIFIGKVNLDQLATGLVGMRSPYGQPASVFSTDYVSGGSSSGSAVSVAAHQELKGRQAGSGRVPAAFNNIIGFKPTRGTIPAAGLVPCCPQLDCIALECLNVADARRVYDVLRAFDPSDPFAKLATPPWAIAPRAILQPRESFTFTFPPASSESRGYLCPEYERLFSLALAKLQSTEVGGRSVECDYTVFEDAGRLLYEGSFVAERVASIQGWYDAHPAPAPGSKEVDALLPEIRSIYAKAASDFRATDAWNDARAMAMYQRLAQAQFRRFQVLVVPTTPLHPTKAEYLAEPIALNHKLGKFTHYGNILVSGTTAVVGNNKLRSVPQDLCGIAVPAGFTKDGMPFGITILGLSFTEGLIFEVAERFLRSQGLPTGLCRL